VGPARMTTEHANAIRAGKASTTAALLSIKATRPQRRLRHRHGYPYPHLRRPSGQAAKYFFVFIEQFTRGVCTITSNPPAGSSLL
jgi:hypothetical protein